jgi:hypothetical protein
MRRLHLAALGLITLGALLPACSTFRGTPEAGVQTIVLDGASYRVEELTASTWTASGPVSAPDGPQKTAQLRKAIEKASNCKVTDSSHAGHGAALTAQVDCGDKLKN